MKIKCYKCKHEWDYKGNSKFYLTCPQCYGKISLQKLKKEEGKK